jgi:hypothetical protein
VGLFSKKGKTGSLGPETPDTVEDRDYTLEADIVCFLLSESQRPFIFLT